MALSGITQPLYQASGWPRFDGDRDLPAQNRRVLPRAVPARLAAPQGRQQVLRGRTWA